MLGRLSLLVLSPWPATLIVVSLFFLLSFSCPTLRFSTLFLFSQDIIIYHPSLSTGSAWMFSILDADGSITKRGQPTLIGSRLPWWRAADDGTCEVSAV